MKSECAGQVTAAETSQARESIVVAILINLTLLLFIAVFGSIDIEESANTSYSAGADYLSDVLANRSSGTHSVLGVPVYDTLQGTGDRLPFQGSWGQSVTWPLRFFVNWEHYPLIRTAFFCTFCLYLCLRVLQSWLPRVSTLVLVSFGLLINSSFGLYLRQNEWSDHYVQTQGVCAIAMFMMHRSFHDESSEVPRLPAKHFVLCLFVAMNGVLTGHPGFWPIALFVCSSIIIVFALKHTFRRRVANWLRKVKIFAIIGSSMALLVVAQIVWDLVSEMAGNDWTAERLSRTQGLFSKFAFGGLHDLTNRGVLAEVARQVISVLLASTSMPFFVLFDGVLPQPLRASSFPEGLRIEFSGSIILIVIALARKSSGLILLRRFLFDNLAVQALIWLTVIASVLDFLPAELATSGAWMIFPVVLVLNVFLSFILIGELSTSWSLQRVSAVLNLVLIGYWCLLQFGFAGFGSVIQIPDDHESFFRKVDAVHESDWMEKYKESPGRMLLVATPSFYDSLAFLPLGQPVVAPAEPKIRSSNHLQPNFAFNHSINSPEFERLTASEVARVLDFLQVRYLLIGHRSSNDVPPDVQISGSLNAVLSQYSGPRELDLPGISYKIYEQETFHAYVLSREDQSSTTICAVLYETCSTVIDSRQLATAGEPRLQLCSGDCLWTFRSPRIRESEELIVPVTFDESILVTNSDGKRLVTTSVNGFLGVSSADGITEGVLTLQLKPDPRMLARVSVSYLNVGIFLLMVIMVTLPLLRVRRFR